MKNVENCESFDLLNIAIHPTLNDFTIIDTEEKAYAFGFFWADGCINRIKTFTVRLQTCDADILDNFKIYFGGSRHARSFKRKDGRIYFQEEWVIHDLNFIKSLKKIGFRQNIKQIPLNLQNHFFRGLIDGDGHYIIENNKFQNITISSNYEDNFIYFLDLLYDIKYNVTKKIDTKRGFKSSLLYFKNKNKRMKNEKVEFLKWVYKDATIYLNRKYEKIKEFL